MVYTDLFLYMCERIQEKTFLIVHIIMAVNRSCFTRFLRAVSKHDRRLFFLKYFIHTRTHEQDINTTNSRTMYSRNLAYNLILYGW